MDLNNRMERMLRMVRKHTDIQFPTYLPNGIIERKTASADPRSVYSVYRKLLGLPEYTYDWDAVGAMVEWVDATDWWGGDHYETMFLAYMAKRDMKCA